MGSFARLMQAFVQVVGDPENELGADPLKQQLSAALSDGYAFAKAKMRVSPREAVCQCAAD